MKEGPILFSAPMVNAIVRRKHPKTQTRRVVNPDWLLCLDAKSEEDRSTLIEYCPFGQPGDRLWVRETWCYACADPAEQIVAYRADMNAEALRDDEWLKRHAVELRKLYSVNRWRPSIFMPKWASRIKLEITRVRVDFIQDISPADCEAEGILRYPYKRLMRGRMRSSFRQLWDRINEDRGFGWDSNPLAYALDFQLLEFR